MSVYNLCQINLSLRDVNKLVAPLLTLLRISLMSHSYIAVPVRIRNAETVGCEVSPSLVNEVVLNTSPLPSLSLPV